MDERLKLCAYIFLAVRAVIDLAVSIGVYHQTESYGIAVGIMIVCSICPLFLFFGIRNEEFTGRYGRKIYLSHDRIAYWFIVAFLVIFHLIITGLMINSLYS